MTDSAVRWTLDILAGIAYAVLVPALVLAVGVPDAVRATLVLPFVMFVPGYAFLAAVYPERWSESDRTRESAHALVADYLDAGISPGQRLLLSVVLSAGITPFVALVVNFTPALIGPTTMFVALAATSVLFFVAAFVRRLRLEPDRRSGVPLGASVAALVGQFRVRSPTLLSNDRSQPTSRREAALNVLVALALISVLAGAAFAYTTPTADPEFTEFYLVGQNESGNYTVNAVPSSMQAGEEQTVFPTVTNQAGDSTDYTVVVQLQAGQRTDDGFEVTNERRLTTFEGTVPAGETTRFSHELGPFEPGQQYRVVYLLYAGDPPADPTRENAQRSLRLWLTVTGGES